jgi:spore germination cell wall hydrolase CwlJ-like protein
MKKMVLFLALSICLISNYGNTVYASEQLAEYEQEKGEAKLQYEKDLYLLSHLINAEAGSNWCSDDLMRYVGSVALNRVEHVAFPNTLEEVIYQPGQYACLWDGNFDKEPCERAVRIAKELLDGGSVLPVDVVFQAEFIQGSGCYIQEQNMYLCIY